ncbi:MAG: SUKH-3 domain-containing protein [Myxococcales bacterium]|nr:SUKH-3 domain-containing protein [Myxococcales bacterium]
MTVEGFPWSDETLQNLTRAGWSPTYDMGEAVGAWCEKLGPGFKPSRAAECAMRRFGGLAVDVRGSGNACARTSFRLDPLQAWGEEDRFARFATLGQLFPLGIAGDGHGFIAIASDGRVYLVMDEVQLLGESIEQAIENLLTGSGRTNADAW